jgi:hypothetical protein
MIDQIYYWILGVVILVCIVVVTIMLIKWNSKCKHNWIYKEAVVLLDKYPRAIYECKKCGETFHKKISSLKELNNEK